MEARIQAICINSFAPGENNWHFKDIFLWWIVRLLPLKMNSDVTLISYWWSVTNGCIYGLVHDGIKPLPQAMLTKIYNAICIIN